MYLSKLFCIARAAAATAMLMFTFGTATANTDQDLSDRQKAEYDYALGIQAVVYGWAPVMMDVARVLQTSVDAPTNNGQAPINELGPITRLWDHRDQSYATPNNDTLYLQGWVDLEAEPMVLFVPPITDRYWMQQILDMYTESVVDLTGATVGNGNAYYVLAKRGYEGDIPDDLPGTYTAFLIGLEYDEWGEEIGLVLAPVSDLTLTAVPLPAAFWLFATSLGVLVGLQRRRR